MGKVILTLDSRNRTNKSDNPHNSQFLLQDAILASKFELTNFQFSNTLHNVTSSSNTLYVNGVLAATMSTKFWVATDFITTLNGLLKTYFATGSDVVTLDSSTNILTWVLPSGSITNSPMGTILGIIGNPSGSFTSNLFLVGPLQLAVVSPQLQCFSYNSYPTTTRVCGVIPVNSGFMDVQYFEPFREWQLEFLPRISFNFLQLSFMNNQTGQPAYGMGEWSCTFVVSDGIGAT